MPNREPLPAFIADTSDEPMQAMRAILVALALLPLLAACGTAPPIQPPAGAIGNINPVAGNHEGGLS